MTQTVPNLVLIPATVMWVLSMLASLYICGSVKLMEKAHDKTKEISSNRQSFDSSEVSSLGTSLWDKSS